MESAAGRDARADSYVVLQLAHASRAGDPPRRLALRWNGKLGAGVKAADRDFEARDPFLAGDRWRAASAQRVDERAQFRAQRLGVADRQVPHRVAAVRLEAEAFGDLQCQQI